jgi:hypothetical protein
MGTDQDASSRRCWRSFASSRDGLHRPPILHHQLPAPSIKFLSVRPIYEAVETRTLPLLFAFLLAAADASAERYRFRHFGPDDGLNTAVSRLVQDRTGFLWVGTGNGLFRYDGARFVRFGVEEGLPSSSVRCLEEGPDGTLWAVTGRGLARFRKNSFQVVETGAAGQDLRALDIGADGKVRCIWDSTGACWWAWFHPAAAHRNSCRCPTRRRLR